MTNFRRRVFNDDNLALMRAMVREGKSASQIADKIGSTPGSVRVLASRLGIRFRLRVFSDENIALMRTMAQSGQSAFQIAERIGSTVGSVRAFASKLGVRLKSRNEDETSNAPVQMTIVLSRRARLKLSILAKQAGLKSAGMLARHYLEELAAGSGDQHTLSGERDTAQNAHDTPMSSATAIKDVNLRQPKGRRGASKRTGPVRE